MSYESEERYWTDYLRVALPVIGLLLMLALFWWWAQQFIGDDGSPADVAESTQTTEIATRPPPTATVTVETVIQPTQVNETSTPDEAGNNGGSDDGTPSDDGSTDECEFTAGQQVLVTEDGVRLRQDPSLADDVEIINTLDAGTPLSIIGDCYAEDEAGNRFWRVRNQETSRTGYISADYIEADTSDE